MRGTRRRAVAAGRRRRRTPSAGTPVRRPAAARRRAARPDAPAGRPSAIRAAAPPRPAADCSCPDAGISARRAAPSDSSVAVQISCMPAIADGRSSTKRFAMRAPGSSEPWRTRRDACRRASARWSAAPTPATGTHAAAGATRGTALRPSRVSFRLRPSTSTTCVGDFGLERARQLAEGLRMRLGIGIFLQAREERRDAAAPQRHSAPALSRLQVVLLLQVLGTRCWPPPRQHPVWCARAHWSARALPCRSRRRTCGGIRRRTAASVLRSRRSSRRACRPPRRRARGCAARAARPDHPAPAAAPRASAAASRRVAAQVARHRMRARCPRRTAAR